MDDMAIELQLNSGRILALVISEKHINLNTTTVSSRIRNKKYGVKPITSLFQAFGLIRSDLGCT